MMGIHNIAEFARLHRVTVPHHAEFDYYIETLSRAPQYADLPDQVKAFEEFETEVDGKVADVKMRTMKRLVEFVQGTPAWARFEVEEVGPKNKDRNSFQKYLDDWFMSIDMTSANYTVLCLFDDEGTFGQSWEEFCRGQEVHPVLARSKSFRQLVFGHLDTRRSQRIQFRMMNEVLYHLLANGIAEDRVVFHSHDELVLRGGSDLTAAGQFFAGVLKTLEDLDRDHLHYEYYRLEKVRKAGFVKRVFDESLENEKHRSLKGIPGNMFYIFFKRNVLDGEIEERDLFFWSEGRLAKWILDLDGEHIQQP